MQITSDVNIQQNFNQSSVSKADSTQNIKPTELARETIDKSVEESKKHESLEERQSRVEDLVDNLNKSLDPFSKSLRFGYDDNFYVSLIDTDSNDLIHRFPEEQAQTFLPKMQEVMGILFDQKG